MLSADRAWFTGTPWVGRISRLVIGYILLVLAWAPAAHAEYAYNLPRPVTAIAEEILTLHNLIFIICVVIFLVVFGVMFYALFAHRKSRGHKAAKFHDNVVLEVLWTIVPFVILIAMAIPSTATLLRMDDVSKSELTVKVTGYQWRWKYEYPDQDLSFFSNLSTPRAQIENKEKKGDNYLLEVDNPMVLPTGKKVRFVFTANDVIHAWWVPAFGVKKDAIPGFINESWTLINEPGTYRGQCVELCGKDHGYMPVVVNAVSPEEFDKWVVAQKDKAKAEAAQAASRNFTKDELIERGQKVYASTCAACHGTKGEGVATFPKMAGSAIATGPIAAHQAIVLNGKPGTAMQAFGAQLNDLDLAAVITFERNAFGNNTGDMVQPAQIKAARGKK
ncbi:MAG TPA: cytochrome c oxidase subunit II [Burkholderiales bacterium]|nr:cytochrome c oxidase subunit II [Burkholderiales bacterium]